VLGGHYAVWFDRICGLALGGVFGFIGVMKTIVSHLNVLPLSVAGALALHLGCLAQDKATDDATLRAGRHFIATKVYSLEEDRRVLKLFDGLRVADVSDGMDKAGLQNIGLMNPDLQPLWKDTKNFTHRIVGVAVTARYVPTQSAPAGARETKDFDQWVGKWYSEKSSEPFVPLLRDGSVLVIEENGGDVGSIGSNNILSWKKRGCLGVVSSSTARDTDEIATQAIPLYFKHPGRGIRPGRNEIESVNAPIVCGGVSVLPGDVIVADGDGVVVVPRAKAEEVALYARATLDQDKAARAKAYEQLGLPKDKSVQ
jgi:regulator of RNase E activity RraA